MHDKKFECFENLVIHVKLSPQLCSCRKRREEEKKITVIDYRVCGVLV